jgi:hypothetical protein
VQTLEFNPQSHYHQNETPNNNENKTKTTTKNKALRDLGSSVVLAS